jgi:hypothetical protein
MVLQASCCNVSYLKVVAISLSFGLFEVQDLFGKTRDQRFVLVSCAS